MRVRCWRWSSGWLGYWYCLWLERQWYRKIAREEKILERKLRETV